MNLLNQNAELALAGVDASPLYGKSVLVTGSTGLIGSNIMAALEVCGCAVVHEMSRSLPTPPRGPYDFIIHAAGYAQPSRFMSEPLETATLNTTLLLLLLDKLKPGGRMIFLSTAEIYSGSPKTFHSEDDIGTTRPTHPRGIYIESKRCGEAICLAARTKDRDVSIARVALAYGPGCKAGDTRVMSELITQALEEDLIVLKDGGAARRTYCYVSDVVQMLLNILLHGRHAIYNVGGIGEISIAHLARKISEITKTPMKIPRNMGAAIEGAPAHVGLDLSRYTREFGPKKFVQLDEGLARTIEWHRALSGHRVAA